MTTQEKLDDYCRQTYGAPMASLTNDQLRQVQDHIGPFAGGGPHVEKSQYASDALQLVDDEIRRRRFPDVFE